MAAAGNFDRRVVWSWALYDFANSPFTTLVVTFIYATYFTQAIAADEISGTALWSRGVTITAIVVALLSPVLGALADRGGYRKPFLFLATTVCVLGSVVLYTALPGQVLKALTWFIIANIAFEMGMVFYNAFLPDIAPA
ncbi:MAG: MFS transporter, partial [Thermoanaerobaculia bacterium]